MMVLLLPAVPGPEVSIGGYFSRSVTVALGHPYGKEKAVT